jgi:2-C-methyl-D-erythritol 2,4-cyclodiphosphate synthase
LRRNWIRAVLGDLGYSGIQQLDASLLRIGIGHDTHRLVEGGPLRIGGIEIPFHRSLTGHSDADVLLHAVTDAILGAAAAGDIGELFPDTDPRNKNRDSAEMLAQAAEQALQLGYRVVNLDCIVFAEQPKLSPFKRAMAERISQILGLPADRIGVKAKTGEGVGTIGNQETVVAQCVALLGRV